MGEIYYFCSIMITTDLFFFFFLGRGGGSISQGRIITNRPIVSAVALPAPGTDYAFKFALRGSYLSDGECV